MDNRLKVVYRLAVAQEEQGAFARALLLEQTVETPEEVAMRVPVVQERLMGEIVALEPLEEGGARLVLHLPVETAMVDPAQFINVLFGNASLHEQVVLEDFELPPVLMERFSGPRFGIEGVRRQLNVYDRPLTASALKPVGLSVDELATLCQSLAEGGIDLIKDDHYLADHPFASFAQRVQRCQEVVQEVSARTGRRVVYAPSLSGTPSEVLRQAEIAQQYGVGAVLVAPMLLGLPFFYELVTRHLEVPVLAHPSFAGAQRMRPETLLGKLFRLFGADMIIFPSFGGRFSYSRATCRALADRARQAWGPYRSALPVPAGGMQVERARELVEFFGRDVMLLIGGSLLRAQPGPELTARARALVDSVIEATTLS
ncbi:RuBisCO large subunit C-terminal-like domain-containing protein [Rhodothermus profundi]|uniref:Ribulose 1,5-bisphosphate carboxylase large subunit n=1 Tax=Rhodothermus profundi TaxID=633813 RepID=A0A1M6PCR4_9BACT|nr:RuBisCO large subunit C-terminal-like domain-containing protein [Rhodothermus profundi]SHK05734.1 ribulose-1,5-bisphosphate carboxylase/oxygenase large subunit [Rhodothermus profundi]